MQYATKDIIKAYGDMVEDRIRQGWDGYLLTFMFRQLSGSDWSVSRQMELEAERIYATLVTRVVRKPKSEKQIPQLPIMLCCPDFPVFKHTKSNLADIAINDGRHLHGASLMPPTSRLRVSLTDHIAQHQDLYMRPEFPLIRLDVRPILHDAGYVVGYGYKALQSGRASGDSVIILPRSHSEVTDSPAAGWRGLYSEMRVDR
ncbi:MAG: hypothetical protein JWM36_1160 [Hyphomicrobiales bacterium]|nr:hypothetical protein [Hyphomicrobiales bacterium]